MGRKESPMRERREEQSLLDEAAYLDLMALADWQAENGHPEREAGYREMAGWAVELDSAFNAAIHCKSGMAGFELERYGVLVLVSNYKTVSRVWVISRDGEVGGMEAYWPFASGVSRGKKGDRMKMALQVIAEAVLWRKAVMENEMEDGE